ncbi:MAG: leucine-rich repeat domain-containing protein [Prevotella sp.]|nr:leucine-rich repeat domain-containing protein [Prevotella sp.]
MTTLIQFPQGKTITTYDIPGSVKTINELVFNYCKTLTHIGIPEGVTSIGNLSFYGCEGLTSITLSNSLIEMGSDAFQGCKNLTIVSIAVEQPFAINENVFSADIYSTATLIVPKGSKEKYESTEGWNRFTLIKEMISDKSLYSRQANYKFARTGICLNGEHCQENVPKKVTLWSYILGEEKGRKKGYRC